MKRKQSQRPTKKRTGASQKSTTTFLPVYRGVYSSKDKPDITPLARARVPSSSFFELIFIALLVWFASLI